MKLFDIMVKNQRLIKKVFFPGQQYIAITVDNIDNVCEMIVKMGGALISKSNKSIDGKVKVCFARDPEGNYLKLVEEK